MMEQLVLGKGEEGGGGEGIAILYHSKFLTNVLLTSLIYRVCSTYGWAFFIFAYNSAN